MSDESWASASLAARFADDAYASVKGYVRTYVLHHQLLEHLPAVGFAQTQPGDVAVFGTFPGVHCAVLLEPGARTADPWTVSHGVPGDPKRTRLSRLVDYFRPNGPVVYLRLAGARS